MVTIPIVGCFQADDISLALVPIGAVYASAIGEVGFSHIFSDFDFRSQFYHKKHRKRDESD